MSSFLALDTADNTNIERQENPRLASIFVKDDPADSLTFDASINEVHSGDSIVTDHPVENGADITDHVRRSPESVQLSAIVTDHPIASEGILNAPSPTLFGGTDTRVQNAREYLKKHKDAGTVMGVSTSLREYTDMIITATSITRDKETGNALSMSITMREIIIAQTDVADAPAPEPENPARRSEVKQGRQSTNEVAPPVAKKHESVLSSLF